MIQVSKPLYITSSKKDHRFRPAIAYLAASDQYLVAWRTPVGGDRHGTFGRIVKPSGQFDKVVTKFSKDDGGADKLFVGHVDIAYNETDRLALVVWSQAAGTLQHGDVYGRFVSPNGTFEGEPLRITAPEAQVWYDSEVKVSWNSKDNRFLVVWEVPSTAGFKEPYAAVLQSNGNVIKRVRVSGPDPSETYDLHGLASNHWDGEWMVVYDKHWRIIDGQANLLTPHRTVPGIPPAIKLYDAFASDQSYYLVGIERYFPRKLRMWAVTVSFDGKNIGRKTMIQSAASFSGAKVVYHRTLSRWLVLFSYRISRRSELIADARSLDMNLKLLDHKSYGVIDEYLYTELNGKPDCAVNSKDSQILVVWGYHRVSPAGPSSDDDHVMGAFVDIRDGLIVVIDEDGKLVEPASVYINGTWVGNVKQGWLKRPIKKDDKIVAFTTVYQGRTSKKAHDPFGWGYGWAYQVQLSSSEVKNDGTYWTHIVTNPTDNQILTVRKQNTVIGFNLVVSLEWDAPDHIMDSIEAHIREASRRIFEATDGQFHIRHCAMYKNRHQWADADMRVLNGTGRSETKNHIDMAPSYVKIFRLGQGGMTSGTYTHELLHYIANLGEEYEDFSGKATVCTQQRKVHGSGPYDFGGKRSACPMSGGGNGTYPPKLCTDLPANPHYMKTKQGPDSCWDSLYNFYMNRSGWAKAYGRWKLTRPIDRGIIMEGPADFPVKGMMTCERPKIGVAKKSLTGLPPEVFEAGDELPITPSGKFIRTDLDPVIIRLEGDYYVLPEVPDVEAIEYDEQADLSKAGPVEEEPGIPLLVKHPEPGFLVPSLWVDTGDRVERLGYIERDGMLVIPLDAAGKTVHATYYDPNSLTAYHGQIRSLEGEQLEIALRPLPIGLSIELHPQALSGEYEIVVQSRGELASGPEVTVSLFGSDKSFNIPVEFDPKAERYLGLYTNQGALEDSGVIRVEFNVGADEPFSWFVDVDAMQIQRGGGRVLSAGDGQAAISLSDRTEPGTVAALTRASLPAALPDDHRSIGNAYQLTATSPHVEGTLRILPQVPLEEHEREALEVMRWNAETQIWESLETYYHADMGYIAGILSFFDQGIFIDPRTTYAATLGPRMMLPDSGLSSRPMKT